MNVLIVIDLQEGSFRQGDKYDVNGVMVRINQLSAFIRKQGGQIIFIQHDGEEEDGLLPGSDGWQLHSQLTVTDADLKVRKTQNDGFNKTELDARLQELGATNLVICGWATDFCVDTTVRSAVSRGFNVFIPSDGHTVSNRPHLSAEQVIEHHNWVWAGLIPANNPVVVMPTNELLTHPNLK
ncbi:hypothetical protein BGP77_06620 [Saccharospirillum sp. MSK14-1]|uniref:cysteine hydrolase family protein n=1 Tax=Saccharospirillum sp. MSK14-1 TaxID=1897632 RepID=UPI000D3BE934|nr:cysteine hydrolase family protein [Saccharospirillum sp. MSK14-1]PTY36953.1 hypothetical protein BGP77_06620 [Saccharospirillum sp. MSK14-1]